MQKKIYFWKLCKINWQIGLSWIWWLVSYRSLESKTLLFSLLFFLDNKTPEGSPIVSWQWTQRFLDYKLPSAPWRYPTPRCPSFFLATGYPPAILSPCQFPYGMANTLLHQDVYHWKWGVQDTTPGPKASTFWFSLILAWGTSWPL